MQFRDLVLRLSAGNRKYSVGHVRRTRIDDTRVQHVCLFTNGTITYYRWFFNDFPATIRNTRNGFRFYIDGWLCKRGETRYTIHIFLTKWHNRAAYQYPQGYPTPRTGFQRKSQLWARSIATRSRYMVKTYAVLRDTARDVTGSCFTIAISDYRALLPNTER